MEIQQLEVGCQEATSVAAGQGGNILALSHNASTLHQLVDWCRGTEHHIVPVHWAGAEVDEAAAPRADLVIVEDGEDVAAQGLTERMCRTARHQCGARYTMVVAATPSSYREHAVIHAGADYYIAPLTPARLRAYLEILMTRALLRQQDAPIELGPLVVDPSRRSCSIGGQALGLTRAEFDILHQLALNAGRLVSIRELTRLLGSIDNASSRARIRQHMYVLRRKSLILTEMLQTVRGCGYLLLATNA